MSLYIDTSCLLKLFFPERDSAAVAALITAEDQVTVSTLARLELQVQVQGRVAGGTLSARAATALLALVDRTLGQLPYQVAETPSNIFVIASGQITPMGRSVHCRTLDRLHLATMEAFGLRRLLTSDETQARAALAHGFDVLRLR